MSNNNVNWRTIISASTAIAAAFFLAGCAGQPRITHFDQATYAKDKAASLVLHDGDTIHIDFPGAPRFSTTQSIRRDGKITMATVGEIQAAGLTPHELEEDLLKAYDTQLIEKQVTVAVASSSFIFYVAGAVGHTGRGGFRPVIFESAGGVARSGRGRPERQSQKHHHHSHHRHWRYPALQIECS